MKKSLKILLSLLLSLLMVGSLAGLVACNTQTEPLGEVPYDAELLSEKEDVIYGYNNKLFYVNTLDFQVADPTVIFVTEGEEAGYFYAYGTSDEIGCHGFQAWRSKDLSHWECMGVAFQPDFSVAWAHSNYWAPEIIYDSELKLYFLFYNAYNAKDNNRLCLSVAYSKNPQGPFVSPDGRRNADGEMLDAGKPVFDVTANNKVLAALGANDPTLVRDHALDASPFIDPVTGDRYLYFSYYNNYGEGSFIYGMKMKDWFTPDYSTLKMITAPGYKTVEGWVNHDNSQRLTEGGVNEGPFMVYHEGKYYMTISVFGYTDPNYRVIQVIGESPLGTFTKVDEMKGGKVISTNTGGWNHIVSAGHHCFITCGDEFFIAYHTFKNRNGIEGGRALAVDKVLWTNNQDGIPVMHTNGPTWSVQALPESVSGYKNIAPSATITANNTREDSDVSLLNDELVKYQEFDLVTEYFANEGKSVITLSWDDWKTVRAIMIFNSYEFNNTFVNVEKVEFEVKNAKGKATTATVSNIAYDWDWHGELDWEFVRPGGAAIAEFNEMPVRKITITVNSATGYELALSEIVVLGKDEACAGISKLEPYSYTTETYGSPHVVKEGAKIGNIEGTELETMWGYDVTNDTDSEDAYLLQEGCFDQYAYFKDVYATEFYAEAEFTVTASDAFADDPYPKFGIAMSTDKLRSEHSNTIFFYVDAVNYTNSVVGCAQRRLDNVDWDWDATEQLVNVPTIRYTRDQYVKLAVLRQGEKFYLMCNDKLVIFYDQFNIFNAERESAVGFLSFNTPMKIRNYFATTDEALLQEKVAQYAYSTTGENFGKAGAYATTTGWDLTNDRGENPSAVNSGTSDQYAFFAGVSADFGDPYPKFGLVLRNAATTLFFYIDGGGAYTAQNVGWVLYRDGGWTWATPGYSAEQQVDVGGYTNGETVNLSIKREGAVIRCYVDGVEIFVIETELIGANDPTAVGILSFNTGVTVSNYSAKLN